MSRLFPHPILTATLAAVWLLLNNTASPGHVLLGLALGWAIPWYTLRFWPERVRIRHVPTMLGLIGVLLYDIVVANLTVAARILGPSRRLRPAFIVLPLDLTCDFAISLLANAICLTPGTVSARLAADRRSLLVHALDAPDPGAVVSTIKARYEAPLKKVFEC